MTNLAATTAATEPRDLCNRSWYLNLLRDESGQDLIEYALIAAIIAMGAVATVRTLPTAVSAVFTSVATKI